jgi:hypothetical protein
MLKKLAIPLLLAVVAVAGAAYYFHHRSQQKLLPPPEAGVPIYPGAKSDADSFAARLSPKDRARLIKAVILHTDDPPRKVIDYYKQNLGGKTKVLEMNTHGQPSAIFQIDVAGTKKVVSVRLNDDVGKTEIFIGYGDPKATTFIPNKPQPK